MQLVYKYILEYSSTVNMHLIFIYTVGPKKMFNQKSVNIKLGVIFHLCYNNIIYKYCYKIKFFIKQSTNYIRYYGVN